MHSHHRPTLQSNPLLRTAQWSRFHHPPAAKMERSPKRRNLETPAETLLLLLQTSRYSNPTVVRRKKTVATHPTVLALSKISAIVYWEGDDTKSFLIYFPISFHSSFLFHPSRHSAIHLYVLFLFIWDGMLAKPSNSSATRETKSACRKNIKKWIKWQEEVLLCLPL